jgi:rod shape-determining protein MreC
VVLAVVAILVAITGVGVLGGDREDGGMPAAFADGLGEVGTPVRNLVGWAGDTVDARQENPGLRRSVAAARATNAELVETQERAPRLRQLARLATTAELASYDPLPAAVIAQDPGSWATWLGIDAGRADGIRVDQPVIGAGPRAAGLIGFVSRVRASSAIVTLLPTLGTSVGAGVRAEGGRYLTLRGVGGPRSAGMRLDFVNAAVRMTTGMRVSTSGTEPGAASLPSRAPAGLPIGTITRVDDAGSDGQTAEVRLLVDPRAVTTVLVLRDPR